MERSAITESYEKYFYVVRADTEELRQHAYRVRYEVYCKEFCYEPAQNYPDQMESDEYDEQAWHCVLMHKPSKSAAGCVRLIRPCKDGPTALLPFERCCSQAVDRQVFDLSAMARDSFSEISRLAVLPAFRRRKTDEKRPISFPDRKILEASGRDAFPLISISLSMGMTSMFLSSGLKYAFSMMEPRLTRMLKRYGIIFKQIGDVMDHHGMRGPFVIERSEVLPNLSPDLRSLLDIIHRQLTV